MSGRATQDQKVRSLDLARGTDMAAVQTIASLDSADSLADLVSYFKKKEMQGYVRQFKVLSTQNTQLINNETFFPRPLLPWFALTIHNDGPDSLLIAVNSTIDSNQAPVLGGEQWHVEFDSARIEYVWIQSVIASGSSTAASNLRFYATK